MSKDEIKFEINKVLDHFSDGALEELLHFLKELEKKHLPANINQDQLHRILIEEKQLLEKLAQ